MKLSDFLDDIIKTESWFIGDSKSDELLQALILELDNRYFTILDSMKKLKLDKKTMIYFKTLTGLMRVCIKGLKEQTT